MSHSTKLQILRKLVESLVEKKCKEKWDKVCAEVDVMFQQDSGDSTWFTHSDDATKVVVKAITSLVQKARLPQSLSNENEDDCFRETAQVATVVASTASIILSNLKEGQSSLDDADERNDGAQRLVSDVVSAVAPYCLVLIATHCEKQPWTTGKSRQASEGLCVLLCKISNCRSVSELVMKGPWQCKGSCDRGIFRKVLEFLKKRLTRDEWHKEPATKQAFRWLLMQVKHPYLGEHLDSVLPPSLLFTDDYKVNNKLLGIKCLQHIIDNVDSSELRLYGRAVVIYEALRHQLYTQKPALIGQLLPCLVSILAVIERSPHKADELRKPNRYDSVLQAVLVSMEFEQKIVLRQAYARNLYLFIDNMGITVLRHMKRVLGVILKYLEASEGQDDISRMYTLQSLNSLILQTWPRIPFQWEIIIKVLLKLLCDVYDNSSQIDKEVRESIISGCIECLVLLKRCCKENIEDALHEILATNTMENEVMKESLERVLAS